jgi:hypothetical protein
VHIAAADAGVVYCEEDIVGAFDFGLWALLKPYVVGLGEDEGEILVETDRLAVVWKMMME